MPKTKRSSESHSQTSQSGGRKYMGIWNDIDEQILRRDRTIFLSGMIETDTVLILTRLISYLLSQNKRKPINLHINTPGGAVTDGLALYDLLSASPAPIHAIATGMCMSMGVILLQAAAKRSATKNTTFMLHEVATMRFGSISVTEGSATQKETERLQRVLDDILQSRSGLSKKGAAALMQMQARYFSAAQALEYKLIDHIV